MSNKYLSLIQKLLPSGLAWNKAKNSNLTKLCEGMAEEFSRVDTRSEGLLVELDPTKTNELLSDFETMLGLPDSSFGTPETLQERRGLVQLKMSMRGGQSKAFYIKLLKSLGFTIEIIEHRPFRAGASCAGDSLTNTRAWANTFTVVMKQAAVYYFRAGQSVAGEALISFRNSIVQGVIKKYRPAHTETIFSYVEE